MAASCAPVSIASGGSQLKARPLWSSKSNSFCQISKTGSWKEIKSQWEPAPS
ncbi:hypothetical protein OIU77_007015 [Salix suchowensis]|uniref:Uncharacterized protein n=1 Tax=Salix suchowensis TaxID=1278906 RepID=A0ABQ9APS3_9ROSI|nr:hypothetical protein OIU77_007015 [Salix suchowensis]